MRPESVPLGWMTSEPGGGGGLKRGAQTGIFKVTEEVEAKRHRIKKSK